ncbi:hypothetical protein TNCT_276591 [Trichonephila clavata]|uniref:Uncharacterized protein n=1 Tax=Trichonephila clavata TaxID=2740835 RepID=A0A8X6GFP3_TRICU|nr:hypothetical protein TNCT_276591 [Trichonephila clavata]
MCISVRSCSRACRCGSRRIGGNQVGALRSLRLQKEHRKVGALPKRPNCRGNRSLQDVRLSAGGDLKVPVKRRFGNRIPCEQSRLCRVI